MPTKISPVGSSASSGGGASIGGLVTGGTEGSVLFVGAGGVLAQDNTNFNFNDTTNTLTIVKIAGLNNGYGAANAGITFANGSQISSNADGKIWFGSSGADSFFALGSNDQIFYIAGAGQIGWTTNAGSAAAGADTGLARIAAGILKVTNGSTGAGALEFLEQAAPPAATANSVRIFAQDNGGKTELMAQFATGSPIQIAIEV